MNALPRDKETGAKRERDKYGEFVWHKIDGIMDTGAADIVAGPDIIMDDIRPTDASMRGMEYTAADGGIVKNLGEGDISGISVEGIPLKMTVQVCDRIP